MTIGKDIAGNIRPIILAGGLGTRLRPRTNHLPKPLLPIDGRPILWYAIDSLSDNEMLTPIVTTDYKKDLIHAYFEGSNIEFRELPGRTMAEAVFEVAENDSAAAFLGMSSDVLIPRIAVKEILNDFSKNGEKDTLLFVKLPNVGHKKWEFHIKNDYLYDITKNDSQTNFERVLLILTKKSLNKVRIFLGKPITDDTVPENLKGFQTGWILILKSMILNEIEVYSRIVDIPVCNINTPIDFAAAEIFVKSHIRN